MSPAEAVLLAWLASSLLLALHCVTNKRVTKEHTEEDINPDMERQQESRKEAISSANEITKPYIDMKQMEVDVRAS